MDTSNLDTNAAAFGKNISGFPYLEAAKLTNPIRKKIKVDRKKIKNSRKVRVQQKIKKRK